MRVVEDRPPANRTHDMLFAAVTLTLTLMTLIYEFDLDILKTYLHTKVCKSRLSKVKARTGQTDRRD